jgi:predicted  nucleic acid-binding Zn-ribbon protein
LTTIGSEELIYDLRKKIQQIQVDLNQLGDPVSEIPELISSANLLRANEYLSKANEKKTELLTIYTQYSTALEKLLSSVFDIQNDLKDILKHQSSMISKTKKKVKNKK